MNVKNCRGCGKIFNYISGPQLCPGCRQGLEEKFQKVKTYIRENPGVGIRQVSEECDVEPSLINQWLKDERLELSESSSLLLNCESCGQPIRTGRYCDKCKMAMSQTLRSVIRGADPATPTPSRVSKDGAKMRFLER
ncbi:MAG: flagellar protein [Lachnospiraceae bacterium]|nr:flagellar protein [Lachnospiraceae bacterium]